MSFTNTTPNYELPQYVADDKPTYLGDFNKSMLDIDTALKNNENIANSSKTLAENANATATTALTTVNEANAIASSANATANSAKTIAQNTQTVADNAQTTANEAKTLAQNASTTASQANSTAETASSTASSAKSIAETAQSDVDSIQFTNVNIQTLIESGGRTLSCMRNEKLNLLNIYGRLNVNSKITSDNQTIFAKLPEGCRPSKERKIYGMFFMYATPEGAQEKLLVDDITIFPNGDMKFTYINNLTVHSIRINMMLNTTGWFN